MASRHYSLEMTEIADFRDLLMGFEEHNGVRIEVRLSLVWGALVPDIAMVAIAHESAGEIGVVAPLASVSVRCSATNLKTLSAALIHAMYALDFQLALNELPESAPKKT